MPNPISPVTTPTASGSARAPASLSQFGSYLLDQGSSNACGTTSLSMILNYWSGKQAFKRTDVDKDIRAFNGPTSPLNIPGYTAQHGFQSSAVNHASFADIQKYVDLGVPVQVLGETAEKNGKDFALHYTNVVGYKKDAAGHVAQVIIANPAGGKLQRLSLAEFNARWNAPIKLGGVATGMQGVMIVTLPQADTQVTGRDGRVRSTRSIALPAPSTFPAGAKWLDGLSDAANGLGHLVRDVFG